MKVFCKKESIKFSLTLWLFMTLFDYWIFSNSSYDSVFLIDCPICSKHRAPEVFFTLVPLYQRTNSHKLNRRFESSISFAVIKTNKYKVD